MPIPGKTQVSSVPVGGMPVYITEDNWSFTLVSDETVDDSDKTFTVPAATTYQILWIWVEYTSTAVAGNRQLEIQILDSGADVIGEYRVSVVQAASLTRYYMFAPALADLLGFRDTDYLMTCIAPTTFLPAGYALRVWDNNAVDAAADDMIVQIMVAEE